MRQKFAQSIQKIAQKDTRVVFLTGDLGFNAFEALRTALKKRFINAGVAEHNMAGAASGLAYGGFKPWIYSIAPFVNIKILEEIRNDICVVSSNVKIVGLGGGYDYGIAGPTHHATEDIGVLSTLPRIKIYAPAGASDIDAVVAKMYEYDGPAYLRLTKAETLPLPIGPYAPFRRIRKGEKMTLLVFGSLIGKVMRACLKLTPTYKKAIDLWVLSEIPFEPSYDFIESIKKTKKLCVIEEHVAAGGIGQHLATWLLKNEYSVKYFYHLHAHPGISKKYGDRDFYLKQTGLDEDSIVKNIKMLYAQK